MIFLQGAIGEKGQMGMEGLPGYDGQPGQKVDNSLTSYESICLCTYVKW